MTIHNELRNNIVLNKVNTFTNLDRVQSGRKPFCDYLREELIHIEERERNKEKRNG